MSILKSAVRFDEVIQEQFLTEKMSENFTLSPAEGLWSRDNFDVFT
jgi:hypothetical protein